MRDGGVWILASTPLDEETKTTLDNLGPVRSAFDIMSTQAVRMN